MEIEYKSRIRMENATHWLSNVSNESVVNMKAKYAIQFSAELNIILYGIILVLSVTGNVLVMLTLFRERKMRTITNLFLLNLAASDMMLSVLCMPFSLVATTLLRNFIFGEAMCIIIRYFQAVSVGVSCYTLVAISLERYYAICQPLKSRRWQTLSHARRMIVGIWLTVLILMSPIASFHRLIEIRTGVHACREIWPRALIDYKMELIYNVALSVILLLIPLLMMGVFYGLVSKKLWISSKQCNYSPSIGPENSTKTSDEEDIQLRSWKFGKENVETYKQNTTLHGRCSTQARHLTNRKRVIRMLVVIVLQYFICWTPIYLLNTWHAFDFLSVLRHISPLAKSLMLLLAYTSSFIHPITYCFMNRYFRRGFRSQFECSESQVVRTTYLRGTQH